jgi:hypothetical protein
MKTYGLEMRKKMDTILFQKKPGESKNAFFENCAVFYNSFFLECY